MRFICAPDHPRSRGVYMRIRFSTAPSGGSSPLARGLLPAAPAKAKKPGIIPARAGFTAVSAASAGPTADHPRSRGVYSRLRLRRRRAHGSSPLARGLQLQWWELPWAFGIIPARAGFTVLTFRRSSEIWDHPRSRGVYFPDVQVEDKQYGSSPLARGLGPGADVVGAGQGIIPARAGFTHAGTVQARGARDHPRSRGVYLARLVNPCLRDGSSPLARGLPAIGNHGYRPRRIIPARAGFTRSPWRVPEYSQDHPRSRGVY